MSPEPDASIRDEFEAVSVECRTPSSIVQEFGPPLYVKIDVEYYDLPVLRDLFAAGIARRKSPPNRTLPGSMPAWWRMDTTNFPGRWTLGAGRLFEQGHYEH